MDTNQIYKTILYAAAKNLQNGYVTPDDFNQVLMPNAQNSYCDYLLGEYQRYQIKRPISVVEFGQNERIRNSISQLIYGVELNPNTITGIAAPPSDYMYTDAMWTLYGLYDIKFIQQDRQSNYVRSSIDPIATNPVYLIRQEGFQYFPADIGFVQMSYVRNPPPIIWGYTEDGNGNPVYSAALSQQPVWGESDLLQIIVRALAIIGVNLQAGVISQYAEQIKQGGQ